MLSSETGIVVPKDDYDKLKKAIIQKRKDPFNRDKCRSQAQKYSSLSKYNEYISLFNKILTEKRKDY